MLRMIENRVHEIWSFRPGWDFSAKRYGRISPLSRNSSVPTLLEEEQLLSVGVVDVVGHDLRK